MSADAVDAGRRGPPALEIAGVSYAYGSSEVFRDVDLAVAAGGIHCLLGPSGSGKSTLLRLIAGLETLQTGTISLAGKVVSTPAKQLAPERRRVGFVFQDYALFPHLDVARNIQFGLRGLSRAERQRRTAELLELVDLAGAGRRMPHTLSGGEQQRVALARALAPDPVVLLLDEPFSNLDRGLREEIREATLGILRETSVATLLVTHDPLEALTVADRISVLLGGVVAQTGDRDELYFTPRDERVARVFGPIQHFRGALVRPDAVRLRRREAPGYSAATIVAVRPMAGMDRLTLSCGGAGEDERIEALDFRHRGWAPGVRCFFRVVSPLEE
ncbi:MAG: ABC transporter ATP-binding protein [Acidobacteria bacterium]|nr:MAG: ABC transporter ATP-binding protein [Acidobacteriota bacterium]REK06242.1 MAG: ABC transporter ATP-binding protein [Acidobacteriota bacterium]